MNMEGEAAPMTQRSLGKVSLKKPSRRCVYIIIGVCIVCILCIVLATTLGRTSKDYCPDGIHCDWRTMHPSQFMKDERCKSLCTTMPCLKSAEFSLSRINASKDPCDDFYEFACGKFEQDAVLFPDANDAALTYHEMENELMLQLKEIIDSVPEKPPGKASNPLLLARKFYDDCMGTDVLERNAMEILIGDDGAVQWPLLNHSLKNDQDQLARIMSTSIFFDANPFFSLASIGERGEKGAADYKIMFHFMELDPERVINLHTEPPGRMDHNHIYSQYSSVIDKILFECGVSAGDVPNVSYEIREFEKTFKAAAMKVFNSLEPKISRYDDVPRTRRVDCQELETRMKSIKWCKIERNLVEELGYAADAKVEYRLPDPIEYYEAVDKVISKVQARVVINYVVMKFVMYHLKYMPDSLRYMYYFNPQLFPSENMFRALPMRWQQCVDVVSDFFWMPLEIEYINEHVQDPDLERANMVLDNMREAYISVVQRVPWVADDKQKLLIKEMQEAKAVFGNKYFWQSEESKEVLEYFSNMTSSADSPFRKGGQMSLIEDVLEMKKLLRLRMPSSAGFRVWSKSVPFKTIPNIMVHHMRFAYGMLQYPMFLHGRPMYVEFATLGKTMLNSLFSNFLFNFLAENTTEILQKSLKCLDDQINAQVTKKAATKVEELKRTHGNIHNTMAILASSEIYLKYLKKNGEEKGLPGLPFSNEQLFFISLAQINCEKFNRERYTNYPSEYFTPSRERVNMPLTNSESFADAFRCPSGSNMNPKKKCCVLGDGKLSEKCE